MGHHKLIDITPVNTHRWTELVRLSQTMGGIDVAVPFLAAEAYGAYILTASPERYPDSGRIIEISDN